jgi:hypothetical protein
LLLVQKKRQFLMMALGLFLPLLLRLASTPTANLSFFLLAAYATTGRAQAIQALGMSWLLTMISPGIAPPAPLGSVGRYAVFMGAFIAIFVRSGILSGQLKASKIVLSTVGLGAFFVIHSLFISPMPDVSIFKAVSWLIVTATLFSAWSGLTPAEREHLFRQLYVGLVAIMVVSVPLFVLPLGYLRNGSGFQGILNHPQAFGPTMAILGAIAASKLFAEMRPSWQYLGVFGVSLVFILASEARTAGLALIIGLCLAIASVPVLSGLRVRAVLPGLRSRRVWGIAGVVLCLGVIFAPQIGEKVGNYISKSGRAGSVESIAEAYERSRGGLIDRMIANINENPLTGIGYGIASEPALMVVEREPFFGLPVGAPVEKGVLPLAMLEELGWVGAGIVAVWLITLALKASRGGVVSISVLITALMINMGENVLFSPGGMGLFILIGVTWAASGVNRESQGTLK